MKVGWAARAVAVSLIVTCVPAACTHIERAPASSAAGSPPGPTLVRARTEPHAAAIATVAKIMAPTVAVAAPGARAVVAPLSTAVRPGGGPTELLVLDRRTVGGRRWLRVLLPIRPNGASGWIPASYATTSKTPWLIRVSTKRRRVEVVRAGRRAATFRAVVGAPDTPTPHGRFAVSERIRLADPNGFYGSWMLTLTGHSNVLDTFEGGDGRVAIHGRGGASLRDPLGTAASHGCVRLSNAAIDWLSKIASPGTPVVIH